MSDFSKSIHTIYNNPFILTPVLVTFYKNYVGLKNDILLAYLIFPIVLEQEHIQKIKRINSKTPLSRFTKDKDFISGFYDRVETYRSVTNLCLQYAIDSKYILVDKNMSVKVITEDVFFVDPLLKDAIELSNKLYKVFRKINVINIYQAFGIKKL
ncbi:three component ABC system middle component [Aquipluma nitroreducens]|nr:three component ABC system middle component [Aquipluma nitroreducens]